MIPNVKENLEMSIMKMTENPKNEEKNRDVKTKSQQVSTNIVRKGYVVANDGGDVKNVIAEIEK